MRKSVFLVIFSLLPFVVSAQTILTGEVVRIADGDTFTLLLEDDTQVRIRLHGIDTPERGQPYSRVATDFLGEQLRGDLQVEVTDTDRYGRSIGMVFVDGRNVNAALIEAGMAWHYRQYDQNPDWSRLEDEARAAGRGLWAEEDPTPPWVYRRMKR